MAVYDTLSLVKTTSFPNGPTARLFHFLLPAGDIIAARVKVEGANVSDDVVFNLAIDGVPVTTTELTMADGTNEIEALSLSETVTNDQWATLSIDAPFVSGSLDGITAIGFHVTYSASIPSLASTTEVLTGTDSAKAVTPDALAALWEQGSDVASAGTISLGEGGYFNITGTTTITDIDFATTKAGRKATVKFAGILTLTHHGTNLILPTGASITTAAGDIAEFVSEGGDIVRCTNYQRADGTALAGAGVSDGDKGDITVSSSGTVWEIDANAVGTTEIANDAVTLAKIQNAAANSKLLGSGDAGSGADYVEITIGTNLTMTGTTLSASLAGGAVDTANSPNAGEWAKFTDADTIEGRTDAEIIGDLSLEIGVDVQAYDAQLDTWAGITPGANVGTFLATPSSANLLAALTDETGTGSAVFGTAPTLNNPKIDLDASNAADDTYSGIQLSGRVAASGGLTQFDAVYINTSSEIALADANGSSTYPAIGLAAGTVSAAAAAIVITHGPVRNDAWAWGSIGQPIFLSATAGGLTQTAPSTSGDKVQVIGVAISADEMFVNPSLDYLTIT